MLKKRKEREKGGRKGKRGIKGKKNVRNEISSTSNGFLAGFAVPDPDRVALYGVFAAEGAYVSILMIFLGISFW